MLLLERAAFTSGDELDHVIVRSGSRQDLPVIALDPYLPASKLTSTAVGPTPEPRLVEQFSVEPGDPYQGMIEAFADAVLGVAEWPRPVGRSIELLGLLERIARFGDTPHA
jgi:hypothetical protein